MNISTIGWVKPLTTRSFFVTSWALALVAPISGAWMKTNVKARANALSHFLLIVPPLFLYFLYFLVFYARPAREPLACGKEFDKRCTKAFRKAFKSSLKSPGSIGAGWNPTENLLISAH
jgi:hypothetical protein